MSTLCISAIVTGKVQGVFYRSNLQKKAQSLNLTGWVKNNEDGTVELRACGSEENINVLIAWLWKGPWLAKVTSVDWQKIAEENYKEFNIIR